MNWCLITDKAFLTKKRLKIPLYVSIVVFFCQKILNLMPKHPVWTPCPSRVCFKWIVVAFGEKVNEATVSFGLLVLLPYAALVFIIIMMI